MAKIQYTPAQNAAIHWNGGNLLLSAAAGSGKTATLTGRILWLLTHEDVSIREMCIVTYTRAAAAELRERIAARLREQVQETGSRHLAGQLAELSGAEISTIHAFLYRNLRPLFPALGLSPDFVIGDEAIMAQLRAEAMAEITDECFDRGEADFLTLADTLSAARDTETLDKTLLEIDRALSSAGKTPDTLAEYAATLSATADCGADFFRLPQSEPLKARLTAALAHFCMAITETRMAFTPEVETKYGPSADAFLDWLHRIETALAGDSYSAVRDALSDSRLPRLATIQSKNATLESLRFKELRNEGKKALETLRQSLFVFEPAQIPAVCTRTAALLTALAAVLSAYTERYRTKKRAKGLLDYGDLESFALALFLDGDGNPTPVAAEVGRKYKYIFIDEYQDTNDVQDAIFRAISPCAHRFLVGDVKQSIYRFRGAEPAVFSRYRDRWTPLSPEEAAGKTDADFAPDEGYSLFMSENFRCDRAVIELTNLVSALLFPHGAISYTDDDALLFGKGGDGAEAAEICLIEKPSRAGADAEDTEEEAEAGDTDDSGDAEDPEAAYVAERIRDYLTHGLSDGTPVTPEDIAILLRSPEASGEKYRTALAKRHIPVTSPNADPLFVSPAVLLALCMAYTADNPLRDIYVAGALHSPLFGLTTAELTEVHRQNPELPLYIAVETAASPAESPDAEAPAPSDTAQPPLSPATIDKLRRFLAGLPEMRAWARNLTADRFFERLFAAYRFFELPEVAEDPMEARNLQSLYELSRKHGAGGVSAFLQITETLRDNARMENESVSGVTLTSIHKSKGLEYPIVIVPECAKKRNARDESAGILFDSALGFGLRLPDTGGFVRCDTILRAAIAEKKRMESVAEEMRVLYVALTRARTKLICTAKVKDPEAYVEKYRMEAAYPSAYRITTADTYIEWLLLAFFSDLPSHLREIRLITGDTSHAQAKDTAAQPEKASVQAEKIVEMPCAPYAYPTPEYAAIPTKVSVSALHPGVVDEWLRQSDVAVGVDAEADPAMDNTMETDTADTGDGIAAEDAPAARDTETDTEASAAESPVAEDVIVQAMHNHVPLPRFLTGMDEIRTPADRGTATHMFLQFADFDRLWQTDVDTELTRLVQTHYLTAETARLTYRGQLARFRESDLFRRMRESREIHREFRFNAALPAARFTNDPALRDKLTGDGIALTVQGVVDCVFRDTDGTLTLVDYKTDHANAADRADPAAFADKLRMRHRDQLTYYREICERLFSEPIRTVLYATAVGREIPLE